LIDRYRIIFEELPFWGLFFCLYRSNQNQIIMHIGEVLSMDHRERNGFILEASDNHIVFMLSSVVGPTIAEQDKVNCDVVETPERQAINISKVESDEE
jgi:hypothetical protein